MSVFAWSSQRIGGLSVLALLSLCYWVITRESNTVNLHSQDGETSSQIGFSSLKAASRGGVWTFVFAYYCLLVHFFVFLCPIRACWAVSDITKALKRSAQSKAVEEYKRPAVHRSASCLSIASSETLSSDMTSSSMAVNDLSDIETEKEAEKSVGRREFVIHAIMIPNYKENADTLKETLDVLASHSQASISYDVFLGMEQREVGGEAKAIGLLRDYNSKFHYIDYTLHPADIPGEAAGKGSNMAWIARKLSAKYSFDERRNVIVTGMDADSHFSSKYFASVASIHQLNPETANIHFYSAPVVFDRNAHEVPALVRAADILWCAAGMSGLYQGSSIAPPTSVYSLPLALVDRVGGWDAGAEAIGEDLHMYLKCFFAMNGNLRSQVVYSPVSQSNITAGGKGGIRGVYLDIMARYKQSLRHMWGALDSGFALRKLVELWRDRSCTSRVFRPLHRTQGNSSDFYLPECHAADGDVKQTTDSGVFSESTQETVEEPHWEMIYYLFHRLFEAHFLPLHMTIMVVASALFALVTDGKEDVNGLGWVFALSRFLRVAGLVEVMCYLFLYESYHRVAVASREREMTKAGLADGMCFSRRSLKGNIFDYTLVPVVAPLFGALPSVHAAIAHFWTVNLEYAVSGKATRKRAKSAVGQDMA